MDAQCPRITEKKAMERSRPFILLLIIYLLMPLSLQAQDKGKVAVLPFKIHSLEPLDHLKQEIQRMFSDRMAAKGFTVIPQEQVNTHPMAFLPLLKTDDILALGRDLQADHIIAGSLTQIGKKISLDLRIVDIQARKAPFSVFVVEDDLEKLQEAADKATKSLYNQIAGVEQIESLEVRGNRRIESEAIISILESKKGEALDYEVLDKDLRAIYAMGFFKDVKIETSDGTKGKNITFVVSEKSAIASISFKGNRKIKDKELRAESGIKQYSILNLSKIKQSVNRMRELYRQKGYYNIKIEDQIQSLPQNEVSLTYHIQEGDKVYLKKIEFVGNEKFDDDDLKDLMETREKGLFSFITHSGVLDKKKLEFDLQKVTAFYHNHGFIRAKTGEPEVSYEEGVGLVITIEVIEGPPYRVDTVTVDGDLIKPSEELLEKVGINKEEYFNREIVRKDTLVLREIYADEGYAYVEVAPLTKEDNEKHLVDITYKITKNQKVRLERINITGNTVTRDKVIRRELHVIEGDYFSGKGMKKSSENLHRLGYFENIEIQPKKGTKDDLMILDINVKERATGSFGMGAGYSTFDKVMGSFQISERNLFGTGQMLSAAARLGSKSTQFDIKFREPWFLDKRLKLGVNLIKWEREYTTYTKDSRGGALLLAFPVKWDEYTEIETKYSYDDADITDIEEYASTLVKDMEGRNVTSSFQVRIARDSTNDLWNPTKGSKNAFSVEYAGGVLGGDVYFNKYELHSIWFFPAWWETVFMAKGSWGLVDGRSGGKLPIYQKYTLGGIHSVRGFDPNSISPKDPDTGDSIGGEKMMTYSFEYRFPVVKEQGVVGLVFLDAGNVFSENDSYTFNGIKKSVGTGIRWYSPIGPIRLEYGWVVGPEEGEPSGNFEFSIGGMF